jgi:hypothetical protein
MEILEHGKRRNVEEQNEMAGFRYYLEKTY